MNAADLAGLAAASLTAYHVPPPDQRSGARVNLKEIARVLTATGTMHLAEPLAPTKKLPAQYVSALYSVLYGRPLSLLNQYEWGRVLKHAGFTVRQQTMQAVRLDVAALDLPPQRREWLTILLRQCPAALDEFLQPQVSACRQQFTQTLLVLEATKVALS